MNNFLDHLQMLVGTNATPRVLCHSYRSCRWLIGSRDFCQTVLLRAIEHRHAFRGETTAELRGWLRAIGRLFPKSIVMGRPCTGGISLYVLVFLALLLNSRAAAQETGGRDLLEFASGAHRASRESVHTLFCRVKHVVKFEEAGRLPQSNSSECWYSPDAIRTKFSDAGGQYDCFWKNHIRKTVVRQIVDGRSQVGAQQDSFAEMHLSATTDPFEVGLLVLNLPATITALPFEQLVDKASRIGRIERRKAETSNLVVVQLFFDKSGARQQKAWEVDVFLDAQKNYLVKKVTYEAALEDGILRRELEVVDFKEFAPGVFFPTRVAGGSELAGKRLTTVTAEVSDVAINRPLPQGIFDFRFPEGVILSDGISGTSYRVDTHGNRISPATPLAGVPPPSASDVDSSSGGKESREEPRSATRWILPVSACLFVTAVLVAIFRRWRTRYVHPSAT